MGTLLQKRLEEELLGDQERGTIVWNELGQVNRAAYAQRLGVTRRALCQNILGRFDALGPRKPQIESVLRSLLDDDLHNGVLVLSKPGAINKKHYARLAQCSNTQYYKALFEEYETKAGGLRTATALEDLLSRDFERGTLKFSRGGKIDRTRYASALGVHKAALTNYIQIFAVFEKWVGGAKRYRDDDICRMADWLRESHLAGKLRFRANGKMVRQQFKDAFEITYNDFEIRFPEIGALIAQYDRRGPTSLIFDLINVDPELTKSQGVFKNLIVSASTETHDADLPDRQGELPSYSSAGGEDIVSEVGEFDPKKVREDHVLIAVDAASGQFDHEVIAVTQEHEDLDEPSGDNPVEVDSDLAGLYSGQKQPIGQYDCADDLSSSEPDSGTANAKEEVGHQDLTGPLLVYYPKLKRHQCYDQRSVAARIVSVLNEFVLGPGLPKCLDGSLNRIELLPLLRFTRAELLAHDQILTDYDVATRLMSWECPVTSQKPVSTSFDKFVAKHQSYAPLSAFGRAVAVLNAMLDDGTFPCVAGGPDHEALAKAFGIRPQSLDPYKPIIDDYHRLDRARRRFPARSLRETAHDGLNIITQTSTPADQTRPPVPQPSETLSPARDEPTLNQHRVPSGTQSSDAPAEQQEASPAPEDARGGEPQCPAKSTIGLTGDIHPKLEKHQHYDPDTTRGRLVAVLNEDLQTGDIPRSRGGKIDRRRLCAIFGFSITGMNNYVDILEDYERATGGLVNVHQRRIPEMEEWLRTGMDNGSLEVRDGKVERQAFFRHFDLPETNTVFGRNPRIQELISRYDNLIQTSGYLPQRLRDEVNLLKKALESDPPIFKTGLSHDRTTLAKITGISIGRILRSPFKEVLDEADAILEQSVVDDPLCHVIEGRLFSFSDLTAAGWEVSFLRQLARAFKKAYDAKPAHETKQAYNVLKELLRFIAASADPSCSGIRAGLNTGSARSVRAKDWTLGTQLYASWLDSRDDHSGATAKTKLMTATGVLRHLGNAGALPELESPLRSKGEASQHRRTLAQEPRREGVDDYLAFATAMLRDAAKLRAIEVDKNSETGFLLTLRTELTGTSARDGDTPSSVILRVLKRRLVAIKDALAKIYMKWRGHWERGQSLLQQGSSIGSDWRASLLPSSLNNDIRKTNLRAVFPLDDPDRATGNFIKLLSDHFHGLFPDNEYGTGPYGQFFNKRALELGGKIHLQALIYPHIDAVAAVALLTMCESGMNVAVARTLFTDAMEASSIGGATHVTGEKARARGKPIHAHLDNRSNAVMGMKWLLDASTGLRSLLSSDDQKLLFVTQTPKFGPKYLEEYFLRDFLKRVVADIPELADLNVTPAMLRPTVLLIAALEGDGGLRISANLGQHGDNVNQGYSDHPPTRFNRDAEVRDFVDSLQAVSFHMNEDVQEWLGYSKTEVEAKIDDVMETGLGTFCRDLHGRPGNDGAKCKTFDCWNSCPQMIFIPRKRELVLLIIWKASLIEAEAEWVRDRPERWYGLWFYWLEFIAAVERKILQATMGKIWREALKLAEEVMAHPNFKPRRPY